jgi:regulatory protein
VPGEQATITAIKSSATGSSRCVIHISGKPIGTLPMKVIERLGLKVGMPYEAMIKDAVDEALRFDKAVQAGIKRVAKKPLSEAELRQHLADDDGLDESMVDRVIKRLKELTLVNDAALCLQIIEHLNAKRPAGPSLIRQKLNARKIPEPTIERMLGDIQSVREDQSGITPSLSQAYSLARDKVVTMEGIPPDAKRRRVAGLLARRGFDEDLIRQIVNDLLPEDAYGFMDEPGESGGLGETGDPDA